MAQKRLATHLVRLVAEEVDRIPLTQIEVAQRVRLVPAGREDVKGDLTADGLAQRLASGREAEVECGRTHVGQAPRAELLLERTNQRGAHVVRLVVDLEVDALLDAAEEREVSIE